MNSAYHGEIDLEDLARVRAIVERSGTSFYWGMRVLPEDKRAAMYGIYAFCREVDDIADEPGTTQSKFSRLNEWRIEIDRLYEGQPQTAISRILRPSIARYSLRREDFLAVIDGMEMDSAESLRLADGNELRLYCDRVACAVGRLSARVFGLEPALADELADALGRALQLTNILRDIPEDAKRDRMYLPQDLLCTHGIKNVDLKTVLQHPALADVCRDIAEDARAYFDTAEQVLARCQRRQVRPARMMMEVYERTLRLLTARGWRRWAEPVSLSSAEKLWVAFRYGMI